MDELENKLGAILGNPEMMEKIATAMSTSFRCEYIKLSNVWLVPTNLAIKDDKHYYVETIEDGSYRKTYFYGGGENGKHLWMIEGIDENAKIIIR